MAILGPNGLARRLREFKRDELVKVSQRALGFAKPVVGIASSHLAARLERVIEDDENAALHIPHYWAINVHDDRPRVVPRPGKKFLVWFTDPRDDPRLQPEPPVRKSEVRTMHLFESEWQAALEENQVRRSFGLPPFMVIARSAPATRGHFFFSQGMKPFESTIGNTIKADFDVFMKGIVAGLSENQTATFRL